MSDFPYYIDLLRQFGFTKTKLNSSWYVVRKDNFVGYGTTELKAWGDIILNEEKLKKILKYFDEVKDDG